MSIIDITDALNIRKWNERISSIMSESDGNPEEILIVLEDFLVERVGNE